MNKAYWLKFSVFNFCIVALIGVLMRYKIAYSLPFLDQNFCSMAIPILHFMAGLRIPSTFSPLFILTG